MGAKAATLDRAAAAGLPVPAGFVIPEGVPAPAAAPGSRVAVRSAFGAEDRPEESLAGWFETLLDVDPRGLGAAVAEVRASAERRDGTFTRDVLVMTMVAAQHSGVAFSEPGTYDDVINVTIGTAERLVSGHDAGEAGAVARLEPERPGYRARLQGLLRQVRREFGDLPWDIEWADDGETCWLIQIRPVTAPTRRNEAFTIANHAEILPPLPSTLMTSVIAAAGEDLFAWYRRFDSSLPSTRPFLEVVAGRPFINLSLLEDLLRHLGLPTRLVADSIGGPPDNDRPVRPARVVRKAPVLARMGVAQVAAVAFARRNERRAAAIGTTPAGDFATALAQLHHGYVGLVTGMFPLSSAIGPPLSMLRRAGTLVEHASRHRTITTEMAECFDEVAAGHPGARERFVERFGHRGVYESDIAWPRYRDDPMLLATGGATVLSSRRPRRTLRGLLTLPVWLVARPPLAARERFRHAAMSGFASVRESLVRLADEAVVDGRLPSVDHLWLLRADEVRRLDEGWRPGEAFWAGRRQERERLRRLEPPAVVHRFDDPVTWSSDPVEGDVLQGLSLTDGTVAGTAWVLDEPSTDPPAHLRPAETVLVARSIDAGWIPTLSLVAAAVVDVGGDLSHGSILLRERGLPAITNVRGASRTLRTGDRVEVRAGSGLVERSQPDEPDGAD
ncbi:MAG: PEP/pyruvate-binding domain-containing protein, partial [Actinomycetota bacterium]